jgi:tRNA threonylcarbamoyladenosine biosynthesis protein TsaB
MTGILAFDTALAGCSVAYYGGGKVTRETMAMMHGQAEHLVPMIDRVLDKAAVQYADIGRVAVTVGPGAFTGLRIGLSAAKSLGLVLKIPVLGYRTVDIIARKFHDNEGVREGEILCVMLDTRRRDFYLQEDGGDPVCMEAAVIETRFAGKPVVFIGDASDRFREQVESCAAWRFAEGYGLPDPAVMVKMAAEGATALPPQPLYLRGADVSQPKKGPKIILEGTDL